MKIWKSIGHILMGLGIFHVLLGIVVGWDLWVGMARDGFYNTLVNDMQRFAIFWFTFLGVLLIPWGHVCTWYIRKRNAPLPFMMGVYLLGSGLVGAFFVPASGFWFFVILGIIVCVQGRRQPAFA